MARLSIQSSGFENPTIELHLGRNTFGRAPDNDWCLNHPTVSVRHCEIILDTGGVRLKDCGSTNGTFLDGIQVQEAVLYEGQTLRMGDVALMVDNADIKIAIPKFDLPVPPPPVVLENGSMLCQTHPENAVTHQCTHCKTVMCAACVRRLKRRGGKALLLCRYCSHPVEVIGGPVRKKRTWLGYLRATVKLPFARANRNED